MRDTVLVLFQTDAVFRQRLTKQLEGMTLVFNEGPDTGRIVPEVAADITVIFGNPDIGFTRRCPHLRWIQLQSAGTDGYVNGELDDSILLTNATGGYGHSVSEHMVAQTLMLYKKLHLYRDEQHKGCWRTRGMVKSIQGAVVLVVGMGDIGGEYARRMKALGAYVIGLRRTPQPKPDFVDEQFLAEQLDEVLPRADIVALALPGVKATIGIISRARIDNMKQGAIIVNAGRGSAIDTAALCDALETGHLDGAALDVTDPEPLPAGHRLWHVENALITPHVAGGRNMKETAEYIMELNLENAGRFMRAKPLKNLVDMHTGYRIP
jgi:phosphoglycerate dehydrogenase-like enzyme